LNMNGDDALSRYKNLRNIRLDEWRKNLQLELGTLSRCNDRRGELQSGSIGEYHHEFWWARRAARTSRSSVRSGYLRRRHRRDYKASRRLSALLSLCHTRSWRRSNRADRGGAAHRATRRWPQHTPSGARLLRERRTVARGADARNCAELTSCGH